jgi:hypothetical protein
LRRNASVSGQAAIAQKCHSTGRTHDFLRYTAEMMRSMLTRPMVAPARPAGHGPVTNSSPNAARDFWLVTVGPVALLEFPADDPERAANHEFPVKQFQETH